MQYKVIHIIWALNSGGAENMLVDIVNEQCKVERVGLIIINNSYNNSILDRIDERVKFWMIKRKPSSKNPLPILKLNLLLLKLEYQCLHCHNHDLIDLLVSNKKPVYLTVHTTGVNDINLKKYNKIFAISEAVKDDIFCRTNICSIVIYNGIRTEAIELKSGNRDNLFRIVNVARFNLSIKGQDILIEAINQLRDRPFFDNIKLDLIGGKIENYKDDFAVVRKRICDLELDSTIKLLGDTKRENVYKKLCLYDLLIQPSRIEGFGLTIAEAMAAKVPVLISENEGPLEIIEKDKFGFSFENGNAVDCANKIETIYNTDIIKIDQLKEKAHKRVIENFDITVTAKNYLINY